MVFIGLSKWGPVILHLDRHVLILGPTRSGKTRLAQKIIKRSKLPALVVDWHGEYPFMRIDARLLKLELEKFDKKLLTEIIGLSLNLNEPSIYLLYKAIKDASISNIADVLTAVDNFLAATRAEAEMKAAIARRLEYIVDAFSGGRVPLHSLFKTKKVVAVDLSSLALTEERILVASFLLAALYNFMVRSGAPAAGPKRLVVVDEAQYILKYNVITHILFETAKFGLRAVIISNQMPPPEVVVHATVVITKPHYVYNINSKSSVVIRNNEITPLWIL